MNWKLNMRIMVVLIVLIATILQCTTARMEKDAPPLPSGIMDEVKVSTELRKIIHESPGEQVLVAIYLKDQPFFGISKKYREQYDPKIQQIQSRIKANYLKARQDSLSEKPGTEFEDEISTDISSWLTPDEIQEIFNENKKAEKLKHRMVTDILDETGQTIQPRQNRLIKKVMEMGGSVHGEGVFINVIFVRIPAYRIEEIEYLPEVESIEEVGLYTTFLDTSTYSLNANVFWDKDYNGSPWGVAIADTGIDKTHPALQVSYEGVFHSSAQTYEYYNDNPNSTDDLHGHGTHVAGIAGSSNTTYRGVASGAVLMNAKFGFLSNDPSCTDPCGLGYFSDAMQAIDWALGVSKGDGAEVVSFSLGASTSSSDTQMSRYFDALVDSLDVVGVISAGNSGSDPDAITDPAIAYNVITVGAMYDYDDPDRNNDTIAPYSSRGPVPGSSRIKPDIMAPGSNITSLNNDWEGNSDYESMTGTSMAAPHIAGAAALLMSAGVYDPKEIKALLINTAEDMGVEGGDYDYGWGYADLNHSLYHTPDVRSGTVNITQRYLLYKGNAVPDDKASLVWNRHAVYIGNSYPTVYYQLSDLDLYMYNESSGMLLSHSLSADENVEQVISNASAPIILKVHAYSFGSGISSEEFALATEEGFNSISLPALEMNISHQDVIGKTTHFNITAHVANRGNISVHTVNVSLSLPPGFTIVSGQKNESLGSINAANEKNTTWTVKSPSTEGSYSLNVSVTSSSYGENISTSSSSIVLVDSPPVIIGNPTRYPGTTYGARNGSRITVNATIYDTYSQVVNATVNASPVNSSLPDPVILVNTSGYWINDSIIVNAPDGFYLLNVTSYDSSGNINTSAQIRVLVDNTPPVVNNVMARPELINISGFTNITVNISDPDLDNVSAEITYPNGTSSTYNMKGIGPVYHLNFNNTAAPGRYDVTIIANDTTGNVNNTRQTHFIAAHIYTNNSVIIPANNSTFINASNANVTAEIFANNNITGSINITRSIVKITDGSGVDGPGIYIRINASGNFSNNDYANVSWALIKVYYTDEEVSKNNLVESSLRLYWFNESSNTWIKLESNSPTWVLGSNVDTANNYVWANITRFSDYAVGGELIEEKKKTTNRGGGGGGGTGEDNDNIECFEIDRQFVDKGSPVSFNFSNECNIVEHINFTALTTSGTVVGKIEMLKNTSALVNVTPPNIVFKNLNVWLGYAGWANEDNLKDVTITFMVNKSWVLANNIDEDLITLNRFVGNSWIPLNTKQVSEKDSVLIFTANMPPDGFGNFAVTGVVISGVPVVTAAVTPKESPSETPSTEPTPGYVGNKWLIIGAVILLSAGGLAYFKKDQILIWLKERRP